MVASRLRRTALVASLALAFWSADASAALTTVSSDPYLNKTSFHATEVEPDTLSSGATIVSAFQAGRFTDGGASNIGWATSTNAGSTWTHGFLPATTAFSSPVGSNARISDPAVAFDRRHNAWIVASLALHASPVYGAVVLVSRSTNGGTAWGSPVRVAAAAPGQNFDKEWIACDGTPTSPYYGSCDVEWDDAAHGDQLHMAVSSDGGLSWRQASVPAAGVIGGQPLVQPGGRVIVPADNPSETAVKLFVSTNGGASYSGPYAVASIASHVESGNLRSSPLITAEIDAGGTIYTAWSDCRFITSCTANDIVFASSTDGVHWSAVKRIPIDSTTSGRDHFIPGLAVDRRTSGSTAKLALTYYYYPATSCSTSTCRLDVGFVASSDAGAHWTAPTQLAGPSLLNALPLTNLGYMVGDYISTSFVTASTGDLALPLFAVGLPVTGKTCTLGDVTSCREPMQAPATALSQQLAATRSATSAGATVFAPRTARAVRTER